MNIWLHRISHCRDISYPLLENNYLSIGFSDFCENKFLEKTINGDWAFFEKQFINKWGEAKKTRHNLWRFINRFQKGDWVLVPSWGIFSIYELEDKPMIINKKVLTSKLIDKGFNIGEDGKIYENNNVRDIGFIWKVKPIAINIPRKFIFDGALISRMKIRNTNADISDLSDIIKKIEDEWKNNELATFHSRIPDSIQSSVEKCIKENLDSIKLEQLVKWYLEKIGADDVYIPAKNEANKENGADADVIATFEAIKVIIYVQVKHHSGITSQWAVDQISEYKNQKENMDDEYTYIPWVVTTAEKFSEEAIEKAKEYQVRLIDKTEFSKMLIDTGFAEINTAFNL
ncbi:restriction endonuclease [Romboutsia sp.]|uniref:restriction endonuclease n=1 Tax=Romboutsia sp. TaxID=1965302 RepID=UPI003F379A5E